MRTWEFKRALDPSSPLPLFVQLAQAVVNDIKRGTLRPGSALPGSRTLARSLGIHRNTVLAAFGELAAEGWIQTRPAGGTYVVQRLPDEAAVTVGEGTAPTSRSPGFDLPGAWIPPFGPFPRGTLVLARGTPDVRLLPTRELARAYRRVLLRHGRDVLFYGDPQGHLKLRTALAEMLASTRGLPATPETLMVTRGSQMAIDILARRLIAPGDAIAVEALGHPFVFDALRRAGAKLVPVPLDAGGFRVDELERLAATTRFKAIYVTPHHQFPTTAVMPPDRRRYLLEVARRLRVPIIEDDYDHEFHYRERPILPMASADEAGVVIYVGTLSKILAPGLRLGFVHASGAVIRRMVELRSLMDIQGDLTVECAIAELFEEGELQRHVHRMRGVYERRRDVLVDALRRQLGGAITFDVPAGGMALWVKVAKGIDLDAWAAAAMAKGVGFRGARIYEIDRRAIPYSRLAFTFLNEQELREAVNRMAAALDSLGARNPGSRRRRSRTASGRG